MSSNKQKTLCAFTGKGNQEASGECVSGKKLRQGSKHKKNVARGRSAVLEVGTI